MGYTGTPTYNIWKTLRQRCINPSNKDYKNYGGRGITLDPTWNNFTKFLNDMGTQPYKKGKVCSIDRIHNDKGYNKANCRWATAKEQGNNRRTNVLLEYNGITKNVQEWSEVLNIKRSILNDRIFKYNWSIHKAFTTT